MARYLTFEFYSRKDAAELAGAWRPAIESKRGGLKKLMRGTVTFGTPNAVDDPFAKFEEPTLFEACAEWLPSTRPDPGEVRRGTVVAAPALQAAV